MRLKAVQYDSDLNVEVSFSKLYKSVSTYGTSNNCKKYTAFDGYFIDTLKAFLWDRQGTVAISYYSFFGSEESYNTKIRRYITTVRQYLIFWQLWGLRGVRDLSRLKSTLTRRCDTCHYVVIKAWLTCLDLTDLHSLLLRTTVQSVCMEVSSLYGTFSSTQKNTRRHRLKAEHHWCVSSQIAKANGSKHHTGFFFYSDPEALFVFRLALVFGWFVLA